MHSLSRTVSLPALVILGVPGSQDNKISESTGMPLPFPLRAHDLLAAPNFSGMQQKTTTLLGLEMAHSVEFGRGFARPTFAQSSSGVANE